MILLKSIGAFFTKIWRWIKETAWVQPLLIVGAIFAIIFSIPYITSWVQSWAGNSENSFYTSHQLTLNYQTETSDSDTAADRLANSLYENCIVNYLDKAEFDNGEYVNKPTDVTFDTASYGTKFFVAFVDSSASSSTNMESGFKYLSDHWNDSSYGFVPHDDADYGFQMYTVFTDEDSDNDDEFKYETDPALSTAFYRYLTLHQDLFSGRLSLDLMNVPYFTNESLDDTNYENLGLNQSDGTAVSSFPVPTVFLVDYSPKAIAQGRAGISEVIFTLDGSSQTEMARNLMYMWNHTDADSVDRGNNPFVVKNA